MAGVTQVQRPRWAQQPLLEASAPRFAARRARRGGGRGREGRAPHAPPTCSHAPPPPRAPGTRATVSVLHMTRPRLGHVTCFTCCHAAQCVDTPELSRDALAARSQGLLLRHSPNPGAAPVLRVPPHPSHRPGLGAPGRATHACGGRGQTRHGRAGWAVLGRPGPALGHLSFGVTGSQRHSPRSGRARAEGAARGGSTPLCCRPCHPLWHLCPLCSVRPRPSVSKPPRALGPDDWIHS